MKLFFFPGRSFTYRRERTRHASAWTLSKENKSTADLQPDTVHDWTQPRSADFKGKGCLIDMANDQWQTFPRVWALLWLLSFSNKPNVLLCAHTEESQIVAFVILKLKITIAEALWPVGGASEAEVEVGTWHESVLQLGINPPVYLYTTVKSKL